MKPIKSIYLLLPIFLVFLLLLSNLLSAKLLLISNHHFTIWFIFLLFSFGTGWLMNSGFKWDIGIKTISIVTFASVIMSLTLVALFKDSFDLSSSIIDNFILYSLRVFVLGIFSIFGLSIAEVVKLQKVIIENDNTSKKSESEYVIKEAKFKAEKIIFEAEKESKSINERKMRIEMQLRELIQTEREVIRNYEKEDFTSHDKNVE